MEPLIKRTCKLKSKDAVVVLCVILVCLSCKKDEKLFDNLKKGYRQL